MCGTDCFLMLLSVLFPPIGVWVKKGVCSADSLINLALLCLGFLPGMLHAWYIILNNPEHDYEHVPDHERQGGVRATHYYVSYGGPPPQRGTMNYGTVGSQPTAGQFPGQQTGTTNSFPQPQSKSKSVQPQNGVAGHEIGTGEGSSQPSGPPPTYADAVKADNKIQHP
ncbi:hypothetical protein BU23DRAFT_494287 [Bimuria novae-zelandiae CBS 107.79]|uniref:Uncharacterized protein n=1 Tax=Bimuria novae-zelandiae CBS 107.79 TaxID=1447943 RepID=A0A6A5UM61_9PLEO|nr:hypothetical protein BU23DRAFT_494287 [Bimuria novae-zelandiae CBS 107.79]